MNCSRYVNGLSCIMNHSTIYEVTAFFINQLIDF